ncbi:MAG: hypothetical protein JW761_03165 [Prolixibacteraceae bacterium]|nr:hypothetical protein [Prolixibacteraceae bacterium]
MLLVVKALHKQFSMIKKVFLAVNFILLWIFTYAQAPRHIPYGEAEPVEFNLLNIILFIVLPVLLIIIYLLYRKKKNKEKNKK